MWTIDEVYSTRGIAGAPDPGPGWVKEWAPVSSKTSRNQRDAKKPRQKRFGPKMRSNGSIGSFAVFLILSSFLRRFVSFFCRGY